MATLFSGQSYDNPIRLTYHIGNHDFGAGGEIQSIKGPSGKRGRLEHVGVSVTEAFTATTTEGFVRVGTAADNDAYAEVGCGTTADEGYVSTETTNSDMKDQNIPADTLVEVNLVAPTGGTPAGKGDVYIVIAWI